MGLLRRGVRIVEDNGLDAFGTHNSAHSAATGESNLNTGFVGSSDTGSGHDHLAGGSDTDYAAIFSESLA